MAQTPKWKKHDPLLNAKMKGPPRPGSGAPLNRRGDEAIGDPPDKKEQARGSKQGREWGRDWESWGRRVRRDILIIEAFLQAKYPDFDPYGDPGDPPPPPDDEFIP